MMTVSVRKELFQTVFKCVGDENGARIELCPNVQRIRPRNGCFAMLNETEFKYPKYELRFHGDSIVVRTNITRKVLLLLVMASRPGGQTKRKCRDLQWIRRDAYKCIILHGAGEIPGNWLRTSPQCIFIIHCKYYFVTSN